MRTTCDQCGARFRGSGHRTATRVLCDSCFAALTGLAAGTLASGGSVATAISTKGWFERIKKSRET